MFHGSTSLDRVHASPSPLLNRVQIHLRSSFGAPPGINRKHTIKGIEHFISAPDPYHVHLFPCVWAHMGKKNHGRLPSLPRKQVLIICEEKKLTWAHDDDVRATAMNCCNRICEWRPISLL